MRKKKKSFVTKKLIRWKIVDLIFLGVILWVIFNAIISNGSGWIDIYKNADNLIIDIMWTLLLLVFMFIMIIPYLAIYIGVRYGIKKYNKANVTFDVESDLDYYRETFNGVSPATMSLLMDLQLESTKDLGAMKLYYELNDIYLYVKDGGIHLNNPNNIKLNKSDDILLKYFFENKNNIYTLKEWKENVICESVNNNLIKRKNAKERKKKGCVIFLIIHLLSFFFMGYVALNFENYNTFFEGLNTIAEDNLSVLHYITSNPDFIVTMLTLLVFVITVFVWIWSFISGIIYTLVGTVISAKDKIKRTREGNILTEQLYGMKNFIRDFSNLDEATRKHLVLWKDFLIYAVVLEENDIILSEISNMYNVDLLNYKKYNN